MMDRITATACYFDNRNCDAVENMTTATAVIFFNNREYFKNFLYNKLFYICKSSNCNYGIATYYFFVLVH